MASTLYQFKADLKGLIELEKKLKKAKLELKGLTKGTEQYKRTAAGIKKNAKAFGTQAKAMHSATGAANKMNRAGGRMIATFKSAAIAIASAFAVRAIVGSIRGAISVFAKFEAQMSAVKAISGATDKEFAKLQKSAKKLGASTVFTASQVAELQEEYARLGFSADEIQRVQSATLDLAAATGESLAGAAMTAGSVLRAFNMDAEQTQRVTDTMASAFTGSALNLERFRESMKFVAPVARVAGFTMEETSAALMKLADNGLHGSIAGNALKNIFLKLGDSSSKLAKKLGGTVDNMPDMVKKMKELKKEGFGLTEAVDLLDKRSAPAFLALMNSIESLEPAVTILNEAEGATSRMAAIRLDNLQGDMTLLKSAMEGLGIAMGETFEGSMRSSIYTFTRWIQKVSESEGHLKAFKTIINLCMAALLGLAVRLIGVGLINFGKTLLAAGRGMWAFAKSTWAADKAQKALKVTMAATPWGAIAMGIASVASYLVFFTGETDKAAEAQRRLNDAMSDSLNDIFAHNEGSKDRAGLMRAFVNDFPELLSFLDLERATNAQLKELKNAMAEADLQNVRVRMGNIRAQIVLEKKKVELIKEEERATIAAADKIMAKQISRTGSEYIAAQTRKTQSQDRIRYNATELHKLENQLLGHQKTIQGVVDSIDDAENLQLENGRTYRKKLNLQFTKELADYRKLNNDMKALDLAKGQERLAILMATSEYYNILATEVDNMGVTTKAGKEEALDFLNTLDDEMRVKVKGSKDSIADINIELSEFRKHVINLGNSLVPTGKKYKKSALGGVQLHKTKEHYKELRKLMGKIITEDFQQLNNAAQENYDVNKEKYEKELDLMLTNTARLTELNKSTSIKTLSDTIKQNKNKYDAIKNLSIKEYNKLVNVEEGNLQGRLIMIQKMLDEEVEKAQITSAILERIKENHNLKLLELQNQKTLSLAKVEMEWETAQAEHELMGHVKSFARFKALKNARHRYEAVQTEVVKSEMNRRLAAAQNFSDREFELIEEQVDNGFITEQEGFRRYEAAYQAHLNAKKQITQTSETDIADIKKQSTQEDLASMGEKISMVGNMYNQMFSMASAFINNRFELAMNKLQEERDGQREDLTDKMEWELEQAEGNEEAQDGIRKKYELRQLEGERQKEQAMRVIKKKQFMMDKFNSIANAIINGALAVTKTATTSGFPAMLATTPIVTGLMAAQVALIASTKFTGKKGGITPSATSDGSLTPTMFGGGGMVMGKSHASGGEKFSAGGRVVELEGGEAVINKRSTAMFHGQLSSMNAAGGGKRFATGGMIPGTSNAVTGIGNANMALFMDKLGVEIIQGVNNKKVTMTESEVTETQSIVSITEANANLFM